MTQSKTVSPEDLKDGEGSRCSGLTILVHLPRGKMETHPLSTPLINPILTSKHSEITGSRLSESIFLACGTTQFENKRTNQML